MTRIAIVYVALVVFAMVQATPDGNSGGGVVEGGVGGGSGLGSGDGLGSGGGGGLGGDANLGTVLRHDGWQYYVTILSNIELLALCSIKLQIQL
ncbi:ctenidin-1-like isoform X2 [Melitaea cinxia]|uniref:ctenidin-1-like isoform X2 n=1 Tax=Melitaea cinxia TaxID=113334 RepID=UPI001E274089|nr:ctenidin-1-like isoform X2 [Melitaea cinxia]